MAEQEPNRSESRRTDVYWTTRFRAVSERDVLAAMYLAQICGDTDQSPEEILNQMGMNNPIVQGLAEDLISYQSSQDPQTA
ncbi:hypothetical protein HY387_00285 [Candidatus Daviesbacteria bacterium]|nr:hypothetical protein [Candidatus Daviesbacteria bacterium]